MIRRIATSNFRMLRANRVSLGRFHVLVGPNATGKTTFLDVLQFVADVITDGVRRAVERRSTSFEDLCFDPHRPVAIAVDHDVPTEGGEAARLRYELEIGVGPADDRGLRVLRESLFVVREEVEPDARQMSLFGGGAEEQVVVHATSPRGFRKVVAKTPEGRDYFQDENTSWNNMFRFGDDRSALGSLPEDPERFPLAIAAKRLFVDGVRRLALDPRKLAAPSPPGRRPVLELDGGNLPHLLRHLKQRDPRLFGDWTRHVASAVPGLDSVDVAVRDDDRHLVVRATFKGQHREPVPSWLLSDGTLRIMALTALSYAAEPAAAHVYLVEEPENGLHPLAVQTVFEALASPSSGIQWLCATHSPVFLAHVGLEDVLVFRRSDRGDSQVCHGDEVPELRGWLGRKNLAELLVTGVLS